MEGYGEVIALSALPAVASVAAGILAERVRASQRLISLALHFAAGAIMALIGIELMPRVLEVEPAWAKVAAFVAGGIAYIILHEILARVRARAGKTGEGTHAWAVYSGMLLDFATDGFIIGTGMAMDRRLGLVLALGAVAAEVPQAFATIAEFDRQQVSRRSRTILAISFAVAVVVSAVLAYWIMEGRDEFWKLVVLSFTAGLLGSLMIEEIVPEAHEERDQRLAVGSFVGGFALVALLSVYII
jgi:zinc transporter, ZIP family